MDSVVVLFINALLYSFTLFYFLRKYKLSVGVILWALYTVSAWSSFLFIQQPDYRGSVHASEQTMMPCLYLFIVLLIAMTPMMRIDKISNVVFSHKDFLKKIIILFTFIQILFVLIDLPSVFQVLNTGSAMLADLRSTVYSTDDSISKLTQNVWTNRLYLLFSGARILATGLSVITFFSFKDDRKLINVFAASALLNNLRAIIVSVGRGEMVFVILLYACTIYLMRDWLSSKQKKILLIASALVLVFAVSFFWAISVSRFGDRAVFFLYKYLGEPMNNFVGLLFNNLKGSTNGLAYFALFFGRRLDVVDANSKWDLIYKMTSIRGDIFYTWVGGLMIEFGKVIPVFVALIFNFALRRLSHISRYYCGDMIVMIFFINFFLRGIFIFPTQNIEGTLMIAYTFILYVLFRIHKDKQGQYGFLLPK